LLHRTEQAALTTTILEPKRIYPDTADAALAARGDPRAFERLYRAHVGRVRALAYRLGGAEDADEMTQDVFVRAWEKLGTFKGNSAFGTWLHSLAVRVILTRCTERRTRETRFGYDTEVLERTAGRAERPELNLDFETALQRLSHSARQVFVLHDVEGYKHEEIAGLLGIAVGTSKSHLHRARMALRKVLA
jgi:RNA polymerase sigma-70 factor (ECF subfamily)